ncbi:MAG: hypothetical protein ACLQIB_01085, partial [Isosphaeraceae bacterium]
LAEGTDLASPELARSARDSQGDLGPIHGQRLHPAAGQTADAGGVYRRSDTRGIRQCDGGRPDAARDAPLPDPARVRAAAFRGDVSIGLGSRARFLAERPRESRQPFELPPDKRLTLAACQVEPIKMAYIETIA